MQIFVSAREFFVVERGLWHVLTSLKAGNEPHFLTNARVKGSVYFPSQGFLSLVRTISSHMKVMSLFRNDPPQAPREDVPRIEHSSSYDAKAAADLPV